MRIRKLINYLAMALLLTTLSLMTERVQAQPRGTSIQETDDKVKVDLYTRFVDTYKTDKPIAYVTAKDYLQRYAKENDQYSQYVQLWVADFEKGERLKQLRRLVFDDRNFVGA
jgi:CMP-2-keto-3-deoxyoctulosonic acid synthetase